MRRTRRTALVAASGLLLAACWPMPGQGPDRRAHNANETTLTAQSVVNLRPLWTARLDHGAASDVIFEGDQVFVHDLTGLHAIDAGTGAVRWKASPGSGRFFAGAVIAAGDDVLAAPGHQTVPGGWQLTRYAKTTGTVTGTVAGDILDAARDQVVASQEPVRFGTATLWFLKVANVATGTQWTGLTEIRDAFPIPVTVGTQHVYHIGDGPLTPDPAQDTFGYGLRAFGMAQPATNCGPAGTKSFACPGWAIQLTGFAAGPPVLSADQSVAYVVTTNGFLDAYSTVTGELLWWGDLAGVGTDSPALANGQLFAPTRDGRLVVFSTAGCATSPCPVAWTALAGEGMNQQPAVAGTGDTAVVFTTSSTGELNAFLASPCPGCGTTPRAPLWTAQLASQIDSAPALAQGRLFVATADGRVVAYGLPAQSEG